MEPIKFKAAVHAVRVDNVGEGKITFQVPLSDRDKIILLAALTETCLQVTVEKDSETGIVIEEDNLGDMG